MPLVDGFYSGKNILITGGLGFMGSNLAHRLVEEGAEVTLLDSQTGRHGSNAHNVKDIRDSVRIVKEDITMSPIKTWVENRDLIFHLAGQVGHYDISKVPDYDYISYSINGVGTERLLRACITSNPGVRFIHSGSSFQYGIPQTLPVDETHPMEPHPDNHYALSKIWADKFCQKYHEMWNLDTVRLRIANPYGPRSQMKKSNYGFVNLFIKKAMDGEDIPIFGGGDQEKDLIYIDDLVEAFLLIGANPDTKGHAINVGSGKGYGIRNIADKVVKVVGNGKVEDVEDKPERYKSSGTNSYISCTKKLKGFTGWEPKVELGEGLKKTFEFYRENREHYW